MIYNGLSQVNSALKDGIAAKNMAVISADILHYLDQALILARNDPALLLVTRNIQSECHSRAIALVNDVSGFVLRSGSNMLADYNARDELLKKSRHPAPDHRWPRLRRMARHVLGQRKRPHRQPQPIPKLHQSGPQPRQSKSSETPNTYALMKTRLTIF
jgi:hypothetical protein